jgi:hypothetical protein
MVRRKPLDPDEFITGLREEIRAELDARHDALPRLEFLQIAGQREGAIKLTPLDGRLSRATCLNSDGAHSAQRPSSLRASAAAPVGWSQSGHRAE